VTPGRSDCRPWLAAITSPATACGSKKPNHRPGLASAPSFGSVPPGGASELSPDHHEPANLVRHVVQAEGGH
jgi:hypothetical protein